MASTSELIATARAGADCPNHVRVWGGAHDPRDPWLQIDDHGVIRFPLPGRAGHGCTASLRRQPARIVEGRLEGGYTGAFELICCECGDHPYLDYSEISPRLQAIRGPFTMQAGLAAYEEHLGLMPTLGAAQDVPNAAGVR